jgi:uncharacterized protein (DUF1697 family)
MPRVHLIRAVNVGGAKLPMAELREIAQELGARNVSTFIASGNLLADPPGAPADFDRSLEKAIQDRYGYFREVISRSPREMAKAVKSYPFEVTDPRFAHVYFLVRQPERAAVHALTAFDAGEDEVRVIGKDLHIRYTRGLQGTKLTAPTIARLLGCQGTGRNLATAAKLAQLAAE